MSDDRMQISRDELYSPSVEAALKQERELRRHVHAVATPPVSRLRQVLLSGMFYLPLAGLLGALITWLIIEPRVTDTVVVSGEVAAVDADPVGVAAGAIAITIGSREVVVMPGITTLEKGAGGEAALESLATISRGDRLEASGAMANGRFFGAAVRPGSAKRPGRAADGAQPLSESFWGYLLFPMTAVFVVLLLFIAEGISCRNWTRMVQRSLIGTSLTVLFAFLAFIPAGMAIAARDALMPEGLVQSIPAWAFIMCVACRSIAWAFIGVGIGLGMNLVRSTRMELRNSVIGGALGGAFGGLFFDPIDRFLHAQSFFAEASDSRLVGMLAVGLSIGFFVALSERLAREAWLRVRSGPLAGKSFVLYRTPTIVGSAPRADIYLFKDADIDGQHLAIHRVGNAYEVEDLGTRKGSQLGGQALAGRRRLQSGDQIVVGSTVLEFEERAKEHALSNRIAAPAAQET